MALEAQIRLIESPQEFMRLCNGCLTANYGDDFLPIADDRADRGNDGYVKSERRLFAAHCFRRIQNQSIEALIQAKATADLAKAVTLKTDGPWPIDAWTFISNYELPESVAATLFEFGSGAGIDVSWRGPEYLAASLYNSPELQQSFPALAVPQIDARLTQIARELREISSGAEKSTPVELPTDRIPRTQAESILLASTRPGGWEYSLFAGTLEQERVRLEPAWRDYERGLTKAPFRKLDFDDANDFLGERISEVISRVESIATIFDRKAQEQAFGPDGVEGDPDRIDHFAHWVVEIYEHMLRWASEMRAISPADELVGPYALATQMVDRPILQWREFNADVQRQVALVPAHVDSKSTDDDPLVLHMTLTLDVEPELGERFGKALKKAHKQHRRKTWF